MRGERSHELETHAAGLGVLDRARRRHGRRAPIEGIQCVVDSVDEALRELAAVGVGARGPEDYPWGRSAFVTDPDGNGWALREMVRRD